jgi:hypothetical protein
MSTFHTQSGFEKRHTIRNFLENGVLIHRFPVHENDPNGGLDLQNQSLSMLELSKGHLNSGVLDGTKLPDAKQRNGPILLSFSAEDEQRLQTSI